MVPLVRDSPLREQVAMRLRAQALLVCVVSLFVLSVSCSLFGLVKPISRIQFAQESNSVAFLRKALIFQQPISGLTRRFLLLFPVYRRCA